VRPNPHQCIGRRCQARRPQQCQDLLGVSIW
jgi:hypothetical protein